MRLLHLINVVLVAVLIVSCGQGDKDRVLHLPGEELTESELRNRWQEQLAQAPAAADVICETIAGTDPDTVLLFFELDVSSQDLTDSQLADVRRAAEIIKEECSR